MRDRCDCGYGDRGGEDSSGGGAVGSASVLPLLRQVLQGEAVPQKTLGIIIRPKSHIRTVGFS